MNTPAAVKTLRTIAIALILTAGIHAATAQVLDPTTGIMVSPTSDPFDYANVAAGQPGNIGTEAAGQAIDNFNQMMADQQASQQAQQQLNDFMSSTNQPADDTPAAPAIPRTAKPTILPKGGTFKGEVTVTIDDTDVQAAVHYTIDGKKPTAASPIYTGPIALEGTAKVQALAITPGDQNSSVASNKFKVKAA
jgi:hypothetical protein